MSAEIALQDIDVAARQLAAAREWVRLNAGLFDKASFGTSIVSGFRKPSLYIHPGDCPQNEWTLNAKKFVNTGGCWRREPERAASRVDYKGDFTDFEVCIFHAETLPEPQPLLPEMEGAA